MAIVELLPSELDLSVLIVIHVSRTRRNAISDVLGRCSDYGVAQAEDGVRLERGQMYVAPPDHHLTVHKDFVRLTRGPRENRVRPAIDPLFRSIARWYHDNSIGGVLSGMRSDGASGLAMIHSFGGVALVQDPIEAAYPDMPEAAIRADEPEVLVKPSEIVDAIELAARANTRGRSVTPARHSDGTDDMNDEDILAGIAADAGEHSQQGRLTPMKCPDCGGALWERQDRGVVRFRCRVGHAFSTESLDEAQLELLESTLWGAAVALEERADFLRRVHARVGGSRSADILQEIEEIEQQSIDLRELIPKVLATGDAR